MMVAALEIPATLKTRTKGLSATPASRHGITPTSTAIAPTYKNTSMANEMPVALETSAPERASPEEIATISMPRKLYKAKGAAMNAALHPWGANPPLTTYCGWILVPVNSAAPITMKRKMVITLMKANQYSNVP